MKQHGKKIVKMIVAVVTLLAMSLLVLSDHDLPDILTVKAYSQSDLSAAVEAESQARKNYELAKNKADKIEVLKKDVKKNKQKELFAASARDIREKMEAELIIIVDDIVDEIEVIGKNNHYDLETKNTKIEDILLENSTRFYDLIDSLQKDAKEQYDDYIRIFEEGGVNCSFVWNTVSDLILLRTQFVDFTLWEQFHDKGGEAIEENKAIVYHCVTEQSDDMKDTILYGVSDWIMYCIDVEIDNIIGNLDQEWHSALESLVEIRQEMNHYDYSVNPEFIFYTQTTKNAVVFKINGDFDAVSQLEHFDMQKKPVWSEAHNCNVIYADTITRDKDYTLTKGDNNTIILTINNGFLDRQKQGDHIFQLDYLSLEGDEFTEKNVTFTVIATPVGQGSVEYYDDGQDWKEDIMLVTSEPFDEEDVSATDSHAPLSKTSSSNLPLILMMIVAAVLLLAVAVVIILKKFNKKITKRT